VAQRTKTLGVHRPKEMDKANAAETFKFLNAAAGRPPPAGGLRSAAPHPACPRARTPHLMQ